MIDSLLLMLTKRWYVWCFLLCYLFCSLRYWGIKQTFKFMVLGYLIAWMSEAVSIRYGFPYGMYHYKYENLQGEWLIAGVPFWDSLSYVFIAFFSMQVALSIRSKYEIHEPYLQLHRSLKTIVLGAFLMMMLDVVIDPLAHQGNKWFLGDIYYYPNPGYYFDVPLSNFIGWLVTAFTILLANNFILPPHDHDIHDSYLNYGLIMYGLIYVFNVAITWWIGDYKLLVADMILGILFFILLSRADRYRNKIPIAF